MLTLTDNASTVVKTLAERSLGDSAPEGGLRISSGSASDSFDVALAPAPAGSDQIVQSQGANVFVDESATAALDDKVLDAQIDEQGGVRFALAQQGV
ncbi:Fe-S cluster assembly protein HesB [Humibacter sp. BT305]|uniref:Fe-S cluster assembly protein HesB n=1 Tax=Cnuibacter physcomitrellae TaxID=1619308 RepID=UPI000E0C015C|nr:Fe-S cluster assembly protein HesB [Cnuibacter physcomitrellae]AXH34969.1 Fe-S cluster assembly protein HesB [Humibacter sp. BT305]MCS5495779.1 Fe-S cluster assembly protein HesB [Cnuibacter physcomitrellae]